MAPTIALITDFGQSDPFVGIIKGVIRRICADADIIDICHEISPGNIMSAGLILSMAFPYMPDNTIFIAVVDPGVGTDRKAIAVEINGKKIICPDNGILSWLLTEHKSWTAVELDKPEYFLNNITSTFHGRDIFSPVAAHLANGKSLADLGSTIDNVKILPVPQITAGDRSIQGEVIYIDRFGNLLTNISRAHIDQLVPDDAKDKVRIHIGSVEVSGIRHAYSDVDHGQIVALFGSTDFLELAVNGGNASISLGIPVGSKVLIYKQTGK